MHRVLVERLDGPGDIALNEEDSHHLRVRRAVRGDPVEVLDGAGGIGEGVLAPAGSGWIVSVGAVRRIRRPPPLELLVGAGDRDRFGWLVEKAVELGATAVVPVETERSLAVATRIRATHHDKLLRRASEALKQAGGTWLPDLPPPIPLEQALAQCIAGCRWLADPGGAGPSGAADPTGVAIVVGPEGGLTEAERAGVLAAGFLPVRLGPRILRFETAALAAAAAAALHREELDD